MNNNENLWDHLLSRDKKKVLTSYLNLDPDEKEAVVEHINKMAREKGWHPEQKKSAMTALLILEKEIEK